MVDALKFYISVVPVTRVSTRFEHCGMEHNFDHDCYTDAPLPKLVDGTAYQRFKPEPAWTPPSREEKEKKTKTPFSIPPTQGIQAMTEREP